MSEPLLDAATIAELRAIEESAMPDTVQIQSQVATPDGAGGRRLAWSTIATTPGSLVASGDDPQEQAIASRAGAVLTYTVVLPWGTPVTSANRLVVGGRTLEVLGVLVGGAWETSRRVVCKDVT